MASRRTLKNKGPFPRDRARRKDFLLTQAAPYGFRARLEVEPQELETVRNIFTWHQEGLSLREIASRLDTNRVPTRRAKGGWSAEAVNAILRRKALYQRHLPEG